MATIYYTASSIDGFIADEHHSLSWLLTRDVDPAGPMGHESFMATVGAVAMGATTYQWVLDNGLGEDRERDWPYQVPTWVFTHRDLELVPGADIRLTQGPVETVHEQMREAAGDRNVWVVGGGDLAGQFADAGLLDELMVQYAPVSLGRGTPLLPRWVELELLDTVRNRDFACTHYRVVRA